MILSWKFWWTNFHDELYSIFDFPDILAFNQYNIHWVFETLWLCLCVRYCHRQTIADIILTSSPSQQYVVCGVLCDPGMIGPWKFWTDALMTCRLNPSGSRGRVKIDCVSTLTNCVRPTTILMAGQLVIHDASEDGGNLRFSRQSFSLAAWRTFTGRRNWRDALLRPSHTPLCPVYNNTCFVGNSKSQNEEQQNGINSGNSSQQNLISTGSAIP